MKFPNNLDSATALRYAQNDSKALLRATVILRVVAGSRFLAECICLIPLTTTT